MDTRSKHTRLPGPGIETVRQMRPIRHNAKVDYRTDCRVTVFSFSVVVLEEAAECYITGCLKLGHETQIIF